MKSYKEINQQQYQLMNNYHEASTATVDAFMSVHKHATKAGAVDTKHKELIALGIAICIRCDACIAAHVAGAISAGATREEVVDTIDVAVLMGGGPSMAYGSQALGAYDELAK